jgi:hypothetical protein
MEEYDTADTHKKIVEEYQKIADQVISEYQE